MGYNEPLSVSCNRVIDESEGRHRAISFKRLEVGCYQVPDAGDRDGIELDPAQLAMILSGIDLKTARRRRRFRPAGHTTSKNGGDSCEMDLHNSNDRV
jgi:hypothetical protein